MSSAPYFPFEPDKWWPDLFAHMTYEDREAMTQTLAMSWHEGWSPKREDVVDLLDYEAGKLTHEEYIERGRTRVNHK